MPQTVPGSPFKAYRLTTTDKGMSARFVDCSLSELDQGDVVVQVAFSGVNYKDALAATGKGRILRRASCIGGIDFSGTVVSSADPRFVPGQSVVGVGFELGVSHDGGYAEYARVPGDWLLPLPSGLSLWDAMAIGTAGFTAALGIMRMEENGLRPSNGPVIVSGASGGVGSIGVAVLAALGYEVTALTGKAEETDYLSGLGARHVRLRQQLDLATIKPLDRATWAGAIDNLGGDVLAWIASTMKLNGVIASIGLAGSATLTTTVMPFILRGVSLLGINSSDSPTPDMRHRAWARLATDMRPPHLDRIARTIPFEDLPAAFVQMIDSRTRGRLVVQIGQSSDPMFRLPIPKSPMV